MKVLGYNAQSAKALLAPYRFERRDPRPNDVVIEILYCGICHSDVHKVNDDWGTTHFPVVPGHEIVGRVVSRGGRASQSHEVEQKQLMVGVNSKKGFSVVVQYGGYGVS